jgi:hypothetical protein
MTECISPALLTRQTPRPVSDHKTGRTNHVQTTHSDPEDVKRAAADDPSRTLGSTIENVRNALCPHGRPAHTEGTRPLDVRDLHHLTPRLVDSVVHYNARKHPETGKPSTDEKASETGPDSLVKQRIKQFETRLKNAGLPAAAGNTADKVTQRNRPVAAPRTGRAALNGGVKVENAASPAVQHYKVNGETYAMPFRNGPGRIGPGGVNLGPKTVPASKDPAWTGRMKTIQASTGSAAGVTGLDADCPDPVKYQEIDGALYAVPNAVEAHRGHPVADAGVQAADATQGKNTPATNASPVDSVVYARLAVGKAHDNDTAHATSAKAADGIDRDAGATRRPSLMAAARKRVSAQFEKFRQRIATGLHKLRRTRSEPTLGASLSPPTKTFSTGDLSLKNPTVVHYYVQGALTGLEKISAELSENLKKATLSGDEGALSALITKQARSGSTAIKSLREVVEARLGPGVGTTLEDSAFIKLDAAQRTAWIDDAFQDLDVKERNALKVFVNGYDTVKNFVPAGDVGALKKAIAESGGDHDKCFETIGKAADVLLEIRAALKGE